MAELEVVEYIRADGSSPFRAWFIGLHAEAAAKVVTALTRLQTGNTSRLKGLGNIAEIRIDWGPGVRIYLGRDGDRLVVLLGGGTKRRQQSDIARARAMWVEYRARRKGPAGKEPWR